MKKTAKKQWIEVKPPTIGYIGNAKKGPVMVVSLSKVCTSDAEILQFPADCAWKWSLIAGEMMLEVIEKAGTPEERVLAQIKHSLVRYVCSPQYFFRDSDYKNK